MSDKLLDFISASFLIFLLVLELALAVLLTLSNVSAYTELVGRV
ncbi:MAG: hypothetical protein ACP5PQ_02780 [Thermoproteota archaeon]